MTIGVDQLPQQMYPADVLHTDSWECPWRIVLTKSRREKKLAQYMAAHNLAYYLPLLKRRQPRQKRARFSYVPAFGNYVFVKVNDRDRHQIVRSNHIARIIEVKDQSRLAAELLRLQSTMVVEEKVYPYDYVSKGHKVRVKEGPMQGLEGVVERKKKGFRLIINITSIFQAVAIDVEADLVELIE